MPRLPLVAFLCWCFLFLSTSTLPAADSSAADRKLADAWTAYEKGDSNRAALLGEELLKDGHISPQVFQLIGHARYRQGDLGRATLWYQRALLFPPPVPEIKQNLGHIRHRTGGVWFASPGLHAQFASYLPRSQWYMIAVSCVWAIVFVAALYLLFIRSHGVRVFLVFVAVLAFLVGLWSSLCWYWRPSPAALTQISYVIHADVIARTSIASTSAAVTSPTGAVMALPPGSEVRRLEERGPWTYVEIPHEKGPLRGWVESDVLAPLWPFDIAYLD